MITVGNVSVVLWRMFSTVENVQYDGGYHQYCRGCLVLWEIFSIVEDVQYDGGYHQYCGRCSVLWRMFCTVEDVHYCVEGNHKLFGYYLNIGWDSIHSTEHLPQNLLYPHSTDVLPPKY